MFKINVIKELYKSALCFINPSFYRASDCHLLKLWHVEQLVIISNRGSLTEVFGEITDTFDPYDINRMSECIVDELLKSVKKD